jgi:outer membrane murein-binding lipoprotein Lpp
MKLHVFIILLGMLILVGCATLNKEECLGGKWRELGAKDGINGEQAIQIEKHRKACAEHGIRPDEKLYMAGHAEGLQEYCQIDNAFRSGLEGRQYKGVCSLDIHTLFMHYNRAAYAVYDTRKEIENKHNSISAAQNRLGNKKTSASDKDHIRSDIQKLESELDKLRNDLHDLERELDKLMDEAREGKLKRK